MFKEMAKAIKDRMKPKPVKAPHHSGKGTRARLNTVAEKHFFKTKLSS